MTWEKTVPVSELAGRPRVFKRPPRQVALFLVGERVFAVDNRCPHEGYPLAEGKVDGACVLTCNWHNWKFRLEDGECLLGGDHVRAYPAKVEDGHVWLEFGYTHAYAAAADWLALAQTFGGDWERRLICLAEAVDHMAFDALRDRT